MHTLTTNIRLFAHEHDDIPAFHAAFLVTTFLAAAVFPLGLFGLLIVLHMTLDFVKYRERHRYSFLDTLAAMVVESIVDISLFLLSLTFAVYLSHTFMLSAVSGMLRSELTVLRALGTLLPRVHIFEHFLTIVLNFHSYMETVHARRGMKLTRAQRWGLNMSIVCSVLLLFSFLLFQGHTPELLQTYGHELRISL